MKDTFYKDTYDFLYKNGYRNKEENNGSIFMKRIIKELEFNTVLDAGCSVGTGVACLCKNGKQATGIDVAPKAISIAKSKGRNCVEGSICDMPFGDNSFELVFSSDCLEHMREEDVHQALSEIIRVSSKYITLQIATKKAKRNLLDKLNMDLKNLHLAILTPEQWLLHILDFPVKIITFETVPKYIKVVMEKI